MAHLSLTRPHAGCGLLPQRASHHYNATPRRISRKMLEVFRQSLTVAARKSARHRWGGVLKYAATEERYGNRAFPNCTREVAALPAPLRDCRITRDDPRNWHLVAAEPRVL